VTRPELVLYHAARDVPQRPRVGLAVPRRIGGATVRNRTKRLLREAARTLIPRLVACDIVVVARPAIVGTGLRDLESALVDAATRAGLLREQGAQRLPE
jgi:ribonuclease P protein component